MKKSILVFLINVIWYCIGSLIFAVGVSVFISSNEISPGGLTGVATIIHHISGLSSGLFLLILNIPILILGFVKFGGKFIINTTVATVLNSVSLTLTEKMLPTFKGEKILAAIFGGALLGLGISLILRHGATTGGVDILAKLVNRKYRHLTVGRIILILDTFVVILAVLVYGNFESALYSVVSMFVSSKIMDTILYGGDKGKLVYIISAHPEEICRAVVKELSRGVTVVNVTGGYTGYNHKMLMCSLRVYEVATLYNIVERYDSKAFITITEAGEIIGEGFKRFD